MEKQKIRDEIDFKELLKSPLRLYGWFFVYFFLLLLALGIFFGHKLIPISFNEQSIGAPDTSIVKLDLVEKKGGVIPAVDLSTLKNPSKEMISKGKELFDANCKSCHGDNGLGDGPAGMMLNPKPRNLHGSEGWTNGRTIDALYKTLQEGIISRGMAAYEYLSPSDRFDIIHYTRTFAEYPVITDEQINKMNIAYNLSAGTIRPNQIPVEIAIEKMLFEEKDFLSRIQKSKIVIENSNDLPGAALLQTYTFDLEKVLNMFAGNNLITFDNYYSLLKNDPQSFGYNQSVIRISASDLRTIFDYLKSIMI